MWLLDTNVVSELRKPKPDKNLLKWLDQLEPASIAISTLNLAEIRAGIELQTEPSQRQNLQRWLDETIRPMFEGRTFEVDEDVILTWRLMARDMAKIRTSIPEPDLLISAVARRNNAGIATRNIKDFKGTGVEVFNPFTSEHYKPK